MAVMAAFGRSGRMSGAQAAEMNIGLRVVLSTLERDFDALELPSELRGWNWQALRLNGGILPGHAEHGPSDCGAQPERRSIPDGSGEPHTDPVSLPGGSCRRHRGRGVQDGPVRRSSEDRSLKRENCCS